MEISAFDFTLYDGTVVNLAIYLTPLNIHEGDVIVVCGTLVEGIGNEYSDIDIYVITDTRRKASDIDTSNFFRVISFERNILKNNSEEDVFLVHLPVEKTGVKIDVEFKTFEEVNEISEMLTDNYHYAVNNHILLTKEMSERQMSFIHRIHNGICLYNDSGLNNIQIKFPPSMINYYLYRLNASDYSDLLDIVGAWRKNEIERCFDLARESLIKQMLAYVCLIGNTDYKRKWLLTRMKQTGISDDIYHRFISLFLRSENISDKEYIIKTFRMIDEIYLLSARFFSETTDSMMPTARRVLTWLYDEKEKCVKTYEKVEVDYRCKAYDVNSPWVTEHLLERSLI